MDTVFIPDISRLLSICHQTVDMFGTWCKELEAQFDYNPEFPVWQIKHIMKTLIHYRPATAFPKMNELFQLLASTILTIVNTEDSEVDVNIPNPSGVRNKLRKWLFGRILPNKTFNRADYLQLCKDSKKLKRFIESHTKIYKKLQNRHEDCTSVDDKARIMYQIKIQEMNEVTEKVKKMESSIVGKIVGSLTDRIRRGFRSLKYILSCKTVQTFSVEDLMADIKRKESDIESFALSLVHTMSSNYTFYKPQEFNRLNGENLPNCHVRSCDDSIKSEANKNQNCEELSYKFLTNIYIDTTSVDRMMNNAGQYVFIAPGMTMKEKIQTESNDLSFCWYKESRFGIRKKWGFFRYSNVGEDEEISESSSTENSSQDNFINNMPWNKLKENKQNAKENAHKPKENLSDETFEEKCDDIVKDFNVLENKIKKKVKENFFHKKFEEKPHDIVKDLNVTENKLKQKVKENVSHDKMEEKSHDIVKDFNVKEDKLKQKVKENISHDKMEEKSNDIVKDFKCMDECLNRNEYDPIMKGLLNDMEEKRARRNEMREKLRLRRLEREQELEGEKEDMIEKGRRERRRNRERMNQLNLDILQ